METAAKVYSGSVSPYRSQREKGALVIEGLGVVAIGTVIGYAGLLLLGEYRRAFFQNPRTVMTLEVVLQVLRLGGPGYLAMVCLVSAVVLVSAGIFISAMETIRQVSRAYAG